MRLRIAHITTPKLHALSAGRERLEACHRELRLSFRQIGFGQFFDREFGIRGKAAPHGRSRIGQGERAHGKLEADIGRIGRSIGHPQSVGARDAL